MTAAPTHPLAGLTVLVTRPAGQAEGLCKLIAEAGGEPVPAPLLNIAPVANPAPALERLNLPPGWDWLIFISANAVRQLAAIEGWNGPGARTRIAAVGEATAATLQAAGLPIDLVPDPPFNSEALLADPRLTEVAGQRILIVRGEGGREWLATALRDRGAATEYAEVYRRLPVTEEQFAPFLDPWSEGRYDAVVITSGDALNRANEVLRGAGLEQQTRPLLVVPGERLADLALEQGWPQVIVAETAGDEAIVQALKQLAHARRTGQGPVALRTRPAAGAASPLEPPPASPAQPVTDSSPRMPEREADQPTEGDTPLSNEEQDMPPANTAGPDAELPDMATEPDNGAPTQPPTRKTRSMAWIGYMMLLGVLALAAGGWFLLQELRSRQEGLGGQISDKSQQVQQVTHQLNSIQSEMASLHSQVATVQSQLSNEDTQLERTLKERGDQFDMKLDGTRNELAAAIQQIQRQLNRTRGDVLIADAEYLLNIANQKLHLVGDVKSVLAAMEAADQRLHESADPAVFKVREALAGEIAALRAMPAPDVVGLSARLVSLEKKVPGLPLILPHAGTIKEHERLKEKASDQTPEEPDDALDSTLRGIKDLVTLRRTDRPIEAVLTPEQAEALRQMLLLKLETTRAALLRNDEQLYRDCLATAIDWVGEHFDTSASETRAMLDELRALSQRSLGVAYPDISQSMIMLQNIEKLRLEAEDEVMRGKRPPTPPAPSPTLENQPNAASGATPADPAKGGKTPAATPQTTERTPAAEAEAPTANPAPGTGSDTLPTASPPQEAQPQEDQGAHP